MTPLFDLATPRRPAKPASLQALETKRANRRESQLQVFTLLHDAIAATGHHDFTAGELAAYTGLALLNLRPRLSELEAMRLVQSGPARQNRVEGYRPAHGYWCAVPLAAVARMQKKDEGAG